MEKSFDKIFLLIKVLEKKKSISKDAVITDSSRGEALFIAYAMIITLKVSSRFILIKLLLFLA